MLSIMKKPKSIITEDNDININTNSDPYIDFEYTTKHKHNTLTMSYHLTPDWLPHPNPKYKDNIVNRYCLYGINCDSKCKNSEGFCMELHPNRWEYFPPSYISHIAKLPINNHPTNHLNITLPPAWIYLAFRYKEATTTKNDTLCCKFGITCNKVFACPYRHPQENHHYAVNTYEHNTAFHNKIYNSKNNEHMSTKNINLINYKLPNTKYHNNNNEFNINNHENTYENVYTNINTHTHTPNDTLTHTYYNNINIPHMYNHNNTYDITYINNNTNTHTHTQ